MSRGGLQIDRRSLDRVMKNIEKRLEQQKRDAAKAVAEAAAAVFAESQAEVPVQTGALKASGRLEVRGLEVSISYDTEYAVEVHEDLGAPRASGKAKYLEDPIRRAAANFGREIAEKIRIK